jgi:hypothetical protein
MGRLKVVSVVCIMLVAYFTFIFHDALSFLSTVPNYGNENCKYIPGGLKGFEDITWYGNFALASQDDRAELWWKNRIHDLENGSIVLIDPVKESVRKLEMRGWPADVNFHPHGIHLYEKSLYVVNHAYKGGERVEILDLITDTDVWHLNYQQSVQFTDRFMSILNDLLVVAPGQFYVTQYLSQPASRTHGRTHSLISTFKFILEKIFTEISYVHFCEIGEGGKAKCRD